MNMYICFIGPPGSGKTMAKRVAKKALEKMFEVHSDVDEGVDGMGRIHSSPIKCFLEVKLKPKRR